MEDLPYVLSNEENNKGCNRCTTKFKATLNKILLKLEKKMFLKSFFP